MFAFIGVLMTACSGENAGSLDNNNSGDNESIEKTTLKFAYGWGEDDFEYQYKEPIEEALPHIELEWIDANIAVPEDVEELLAKGIVPDLWVGSGASQIGGMQNFEMDFAIDELFERHGFDWDRVDANIVESLRNRAHDQQIYMIPIYQSADNLYYNKDIFDLFGVDYPTDHMTWEEVRDLAAEVTGEIDGKQYRGFDINSPRLMLEQRQVTHLDPETDEVLYLKEPIYSEYLHYLERLWSIPGMLPEENPREYLFSWGANFFNDHDVAMTVAWDRFPHAEAYEEQGLNWDMVTMPVWEDQPNMITPPDGYAIFPTRDTEHPDEVYEVLEHILSDEYQEWASRHLGRPTVLNNPDIQETLASEIKGLEDKNMESIFIMDRNPGLPVDEVSEYAITKYDALHADIGEFAELDKDVNTFLRIMTEKTEENIRRAKQRE